MPKLVKELPQGKAFSRSAEGGTLADTATRVWKIILNAPNEGFDLSSAIGVQIGDPLDNANPIPCVSIDVKGDGESRMVRIVTAQYRSSAMVDGEGGTGLPDPMLVMPDIRPANFSTSTSLYERPAGRWREASDPPGTWKAVANPNGDLIDGVSELVPVTNIRITQFEFQPGTVHSRWAGNVNSEVMYLGNYLTCSERTVMFRGVEAQPHVETFGITVYRGFMNTYEFLYRPLGFDVRVPLSGFNVRAFDPANPPAQSDVWSQPLRSFEGRVVPPLLLPEGTQPGDIVRAMVKIHDPQTGGTSQIPSAQPVPLNPFGYGRSRSATPPVLVEEYQVQPETNLTSLFNLRIQ